MRAVEQRAMIEHYGRRTTVRSRTGAETRKRRTRPLSKRITWRANALICLIIILGFVVTSFISYHSNREAFEQDAERVSLLTSEGIARAIDAQFTQPIDVSLTMANDSLLKESLREELQRADDPAFVESLRTYLDAYRVKYGFDSVFLTSSATSRYYHFNGIDRTLERNNPENTWYFDFLEGTQDYALNIDNDEAMSNEITVFVNCRIVDEGTTIGIVGVGFNIDDLRTLFSSYEEQTDTHAYLVDGEGAVKVSTDGRDVEQANLFTDTAFAEFRDQALGNRAEEQSLWYSGAGGSGYLVSQYVPYLDWFLVVDHDTSSLTAQTTQQLSLALGVIAVVIVLVLVATTSIFRRYNDLIVKQTTAAEQEHKSIFQEAAEQIYENIYEVDITNNRAASEDTEQYFKSLGVPGKMPYDQALIIIAEKQIKEEFRESYLHTFSSASVEQAYERGEDTLTLDFMIAENDASYVWMRITAHLFIWSDDGSLRMLVYRQNIDEEKRREQALIEQMQRDSLTGLYNKAATQEHIRAMLADKPDGSYAFFILDIDDFKSVNDKLGHSAGDTVLEEFALIVGGHFRREDVVGRIGGDEFVAFSPVSDAACAERKAAELVAALQCAIETDAGVCQVSSSVGVALAPAAGSDFETLYRRADRKLYRAKELGKKRYAIDAG